MVTNSFEASVAALFGKEAGLFVTSGTLSNQLCLRTWLLQPPYSIVCDIRSHIHQYEAGGCAFHSGAALELVTPSNGLYLRWEQDIKPRIVPDDDNPHNAPTAIVSLENSLNGVIYPQDEIVRISEGIKTSNSNIKLHLDGARIWNVAAATGMTLEELCRPFDSVSVCFSKGLGAPIGRYVRTHWSNSSLIHLFSMMLGPKPFIRKATHFRKLFGAGMRQTGVLSAAARTALTDHFNKLPHTHNMARWLAHELELEGAKLLLPVDTNMVSLRKRLYFVGYTDTYVQVFVDVETAGVPSEELKERALHLPQPIKIDRQRIVIHHQSDPDALVDLVRLVREIKAERSTL